MANSRKSVAKLLRSVTTLHLVVKCQFGELNRSVAFETENCYNFVILSHAQSRHVYADKKNC